MNAKPLNPRLPGRYGKMTKSEWDAVVARLERPIPLGETRAMIPTERRQWRRAKRKPGRPRRGNGVRVISLSVEQTLLEKADRSAKRAGMSRAALFEMGLLSVLGKSGLLAG
jgi:hypothetical protein